MLWLIFLLMVFVEKADPRVRISNIEEIVYEIAGIFESPAAVQSNAFLEITRNAHLAERSFVPTIININKTDSYSVWKKLCRYSGSTEKNMEPLVVFGPQNAISDGAVRDQCSILNIPHVQAAWQPFNPDLDLDEEEVLDETQAAEEKSAFKKITINFYPDSDEITLAYAKLLKYYKWENFAALYEDDYGLLRIQKILALQTFKHPVTVRRLDPDSDNYKIFKDITNYQDSRVLLDCHVDRVAKYMKIAKELNMVHAYQHYILLTMDTSMLSEKLVKYNCNITWLSMTEYDKLMNAQHGLAPRVSAWKNDSENHDVAEFPFDALVMDDVVNHLLKAVKELETELELDTIPPPSLTCNPNAQPWEYGAALQRKILETQSTGVTGNLQFNETGHRINYILYVNEIHLQKRRTIGRWESALGGNIIENKLDFGAENNRQTFKVISRMAEPYFTRKKKCEGDDCPEHEEMYEGFSVDLVKAIFDQLQQEKLNYNYTFIEIPEKDQIYGTLNPTTKKWDGMIGYLLDKKADLAVCDLTITEERKKVVDFSVPFMSLGISILFTKEHKVNPGMFSFLYPYTEDVWIYTATAYCLVSIALYVCSRISPADWENPQPCDKDPEELENIWNFKNCAWLTMGSIMTQGCDILPKAFGTRWICSMWWFFAVIVCQTYIAQLSASMTSALADEPINSVEDLAKQTKIKYGAYSSGSTFQFFANSQDKTYRTIYENMMANPAVLVNSNDEGERRVVNGKNKYAFFMESSSIEYKLRRNCNLKKVGNELDSKDYGIAMPANSPFRSHINRAILYLKEHTILDKIKQTWWEEKYNATKCKSEIDENDVEGDLELENLIGAFIVLIVGLVLSMVITAAEFMNEVRNIVVREEVTHKEAFIKEIKASLNFFQLQKPVQRNPSRAPSVAASGKSALEEKQSRRALAIENFLDLEKQVQ